MQPIKLTPENQITSFQVSSHNARWIVEATAESVVVRDGSSVCLTLEFPYIPEDAIEIECPRMLTVGAEAEKSDEPSHLPVLQALSKYPALKNALPEGQYVAKLIPIPKVRLPEVLLGNEYVPAPAGMTQLISTPEISLLSVAPPDYVGVPSVLVALTVLNYTGSNRLPVGLVACGVADCPPATDEALLIVPVSGQMVVDAALRFGGSEERVRWWNKECESIMKKL